MNVVQVVKTILCMIILFGVNCSPVSESNGTAADDIDGHTLIQMGRKLHKPMLTLLGLTIRNLHPCAEWTQWTKCEATLRNYFGTRTRTRQCGAESETDDGGRTTLTESETDDGGRKTETDLGICEGFCTEDYNLTANEFCLKLYLTKKSHDDAEAQCQLDGGHLIHIETEVKYEAVLNMLKGFTPNIHIGGRRMDVSSAWEYSYGSLDGFIKWYTSFPRNKSGNLCMGLSNPRHWYDHPCTDAFGFICEKLI